MKKDDALQALSVLERAKVTAGTAGFIDKVCLQRGWSRAEVIRQALAHYADYEKSEVLSAIQQLNQQMLELQDQLQALGAHQEQQFKELFKYFGGKRRRRVSSSAG